MSVAADVAEAIAKTQRRVLLFEILPQALCGCDEGSLLIIDSGGGVCTDPRKQQTATHLGCYLLL